MQNTMDSAGEYLYLALNIGEQLLISGAEVRRVEDTITRICTAYGAERVDVFSITSSIIVTVYSKQSGAVTQTRRVREQKYNLHKVDLLNRLSREICQNRPDAGYIESELKQIEYSETYGFWMQLMTYALISGAFSVFFGGTLSDAAASAMIGIVLKCFETALKKKQMNAFVNAIFCSLAGGLAAFLLVRIGLGEHVDKISIGNIMLLIPGISLTNGIRDMFSGDTISGLLRFCEAILLSITIAFGFAVIANLYI